MNKGGYEYQSEFARRYVAQGREEGREEGRAAGEAEALLLVLNARGLTLAPALVARVRGCRDRALLDVWIQRAVSARTVDDVFEAD